MYPLKIWMGFPAIYVIIAAEQLRGNGDTVDFGSTVKENGMAPPPNLGT